jgi:hypothetical protein
MKRMKLWPSKRKLSRPVTDERKERELEEAKGAFQDTVADYRMKMDWARRLAGETLDRMDKGRQE